MDIAKYIKESKEQIDAGIYDGDIEQFWMLEQLQAENKELKQDLLEFGRHSEGCCYVYNEAYGCKCGWLEVEQALKDE